MSGADRLEMTAEELHAAALRKAEEAFDCDFDLVHYSEPSKSERVANAVAAYHKALYGTVFAPQLAIQTSQKISLEMVEDLERRWLACEPLPPGCKIIIVPEKSRIWTAFNS